MRILSWFLMLIIFNVIIIMIKVRVTEKIVVLKCIHEDVRKFQRPC